MVYNLRIWAAGHGPGIELAEPEYSSIVASMQRIYLARDLRRTTKKRFPLTPILRQYVKSLARVHEEVRTAIGGQVERDHELMVQTIERARMEFSESPLLGLVVSKGSDPDYVDEHHSVHQKSWERRAVLIKKNSSLGKLSRRFVSGEYPSNVAPPRSS